MPVTISIRKWAALLFRNYRYLLKGSANIAYMKQLKCLCSLLLYVLLPGGSFGQSWEIGAKAGTSGYFGDLNPVRIYKPGDPAAAIFLKANIDSYWSVGFNLMQARIQAHDAYSPNPAQQQRNLNFHSAITELSLFTEFNFFSYIPSVSKSRFTPYLFAGAGLVFFNPKAELDGVVYSLRTYMTEGQPEPYKKYALTVPYGAGIKYNIAGKWTLGLEGGYRTAFTDYLDDVSGRYGDFSKGDLTAARLADRSGEIAGSNLFKPGDQRGDFRPRDNYFFLGLTISFTFLTYKCPEVF